MARYCSYGSATAAQAKGCDAHVDVREVILRSVRRRPSNAALYGVGKITECRPDAGPGCAPGETLEETQTSLARLYEGTNGR